LDVRVRDTGTGDEWQTSAYSLGQAALYAGIVTISTQSDAPLFLQWTPAPDENVPSHLSLLIMRRHGAIWSKCSTEGRAYRLINSWVQLHRPDLYSLVLR